MTLTTEDVDIILENPVEAIDIANLEYTSEHQLSIERKKVGRGYSYREKDEKISDPEILDRIKKLVIPPGWKNVFICKVAKGHLQAIGRDDKNRKQYIYHPFWSKIRNQTKFFKMTSFGKTLPKIRKRVEEDLDQPEMNRKKVHALIIRLLEETHIRIGNAYYAKTNKTYGLSTLRTRHVKIVKNKMMFEFTGKKGKAHSISLKNKKLVKLVNQCEEIPGWELFKFYDENGVKQTIDSGMINEYIHKISGKQFSAKDFRTWSASKIFFETLYKLGYTHDEKENKKNILAAFDAAANGLGNTRSVCKEYYVHPTIVENYENGEIQSFFKKIRSNTDKNYASLSGSEKVLLKMIGDYEISI
ncbi:DNA topoisomerase IB [Gillisia sp. Q332]|uniref:DNA topoisomerase IB n=1 Tax=Gillisia xinjiangensis TaxID=3384765 RepID=UPI00391B41C9